MSSKLIKNGNGSALHLPGDNVVIGEIKIMQSGKVSVHAPNIHPIMLAKILNGLSINVLDSLLQQSQETSLVDENGEPVNDDGTFSGPTGLV